MKREYDFSKGEQGKFYRPGAKIKLPIGVVEHIDLTDAEVERLDEILDRGVSPTPPLRKAILRLADPKPRHRGCVE